MSLFSAALVVVCARVPLSAVRKVSVAVQPSLDTAVLIFMFIFQQDNAPTHRAHDTVERLWGETSIH